MNLKTPIVTALLLLFTLQTSNSDLEAQTRKKLTAKKKTTSRKATVKVTVPPRRKAVPVGRVAVIAAPVAPVGLGATFEQRLSSLVNSGVAAGSTASIRIIDVESGRVVAERNGHLPVAPASNMKLFTTAAGLDLLKPEYSFETVVSTRGVIEPSGSLKGDVKIRGGGDPTIGGRFHDGHSTEVIDGWANELKQSGIKNINGDLIFEYGYFDTEYVHPSWPPDQLVNWYEAPVSALSMQEGCVMVRVLPGRPGQLGIVQMEPPNTYMTVENSIVTGGGRGVFISRIPGTNRIVVKGSVPARAGATEIFVTVMNPVHYFANVVRTSFERNGLRVMGQVKLVPRDARTDWQEISTHATPITVVNYVINKKSQNHYAEQLLKAIGSEKKKNGSFAGGSAAITHWLTTTVGVPGQEYTQIDGSGMSRFNRASSNSFTTLLRYMWNSPYRHEFVSSMPYSGERDSRLRRRLNQPPYARQVYAKTGYISGVIGLSGYVHAQSGKVYAFSFLFNRYRTGVWGVYNLQDAMLKEIIRSG